MPDWLEAFVEVNPVTFLVKAMRGLMHGAPEVEGIGVTLAISAGLVAVFGPLTMYLFRSKK
jgi:ABC-2 type transport system permease protein